jgi:hypothetical protein
MRVREAPAEDVEAIYSLACEFAGTVGDSHLRFEGVRSRFRGPLMGVADPDQHRPFILPYCKLVSAGEGALQWILTFYMS